MKRVLALAGAMVLVAAGVLARAAIDDGDDDDDGAGGSGGGGGDLVVACVPELRAACEALGGVDDLRVEPPGDTIAAGTGVDAWVTLDPWPAMSPGGPVAGDAVPVASTPLVLLARTAALPSSCTGEPDWACVVDAPGAAAPALPDPASALGALVLGHAAAGWSAATRPGEPFARNEFELPEFQGWLARLDVAADPVADMLQLAPAGPVAAGTTGADLRTRVEPSPRAGGLDAVSTPVAATVAVVVVGPDAERVAGDAGFRAALQQAGWDLDPDAATAGLPAPGVLLALTEELR